MSTDPWPTRAGHGGCRLCLGVQVALLPLLALAAALLALALATALLALTLAVAWLPLAVRAALAIALLAPAGASSIPRTGRPTG